MFGLHRHRNRDCMLVDFFLVAFGEHCHLCTGARWSNHTAKVDVHTRREKKVKPNTCSRFRNCPQIVWWHEVTWSRAGSFTQLDGLINFATVNRMPVSNVITRVWLHLATCGPKYITRVRFFWVFCWETFSFVCREFRFVFEGARKSDLPCRTCNKEYANGARIINIIARGVRRQSVLWPMIRGKNNKRKVNGKPARAFSHSGGIMILWKWAN